MAVIQGFFVQSGQGGVDNPNLAAAMAGFVLDWWPPHESKTNRYALTAVTSNLPVTTSPRALSARMATRYQDDFYNRIHINPQAIDLGNVVTEQVTPVRLWNAFFVPVSLQAITGLQEGIALQGPGEPLTQQPLAELEWLVGVQEAGPANVSADITWDYAEQNAELAVTGTRIIAWPFAVDWASGLRERLAWATDILRSPSGAEQRRALRIGPQRSFSGQYIVGRRERQLLDATLAGWGARNFALPIAADVQRLKTPITAGDARVPASTANRDFVEAGLVMLYRGAFEFEVAQIQTIDGTGLDTTRTLQNSWPVGTRIYPVRAAQLTEQPSLIREHDQVSRFAADFLLTENSDWPAELPATLYQGFPVFDTAPEESQNLTHGAARLLLELDNGSSLPRRTDTAERGFDLREHAWLLDAAEQPGFRSLLYALRGRQVALWLPTFAEDMTLAATIPSQSVTITIEFIGYVRFLLGRPERAHISLQLKNGTSYLREILGGAEAGDTENLQLDAAIPQEVAPSQVRRISYLVLCRLDEDAAEIDHLTDGVARSRLAFRGVRDHEF